MNKLESGLLLTAIISLVALTDIWLATDDVPSNTYSAAIRKLGKIWPFSRLIVCIGIGIVIGHLYW